MLSQNPNIFRPKHFHFCQWRRSMHIACLSVSSDGSTNLKLFMKSKPWIRNQTQNAHLTSQFLGQKNHYDYVVLTISAGQGWTIRVAPGTRIYHVRVAL